MLFVEEVDELVQVDLVCLVLGAESEKVAVMNSRTLGLTQLYVLKFDVRFLLIFRHVLWELRILNSNRQNYIQVNFLSVSNITFLKSQAHPWITLKKCVFNGGAWYVRISYSRAQFLQILKKNQVEKIISKCFVLLQILTSIGTAPRCHFWGRSCGTVRRTFRT